MQIFFSVGEPSGDQHAAHLMAELKRVQPNVKFSGFGGPLMEQAGCRLIYTMTRLAVMGVSGVIPHLWKFYKLVRQAGRYLEDSRPDAVVLIDFPGFNWWIARKAKAAGIPVFYYFPPQLWAWAPWRIRKMRKFVDHILCTLSFEKDWYARHGVEAEYVGHPVFDEISSHQLDEEFCREWALEQASTVTILPGSRNREVANNWPIMLQIIRRLQRQLPATRFLIACYRDEHREWCRQQLRRGDCEMRIHFFVGKTSECIRLADCCLMVSGSVSLEVLANAKPAVVLYTVSRATRIAISLVVSCKFLSLPNLMANRAIMPEFYCAWRRRRDITTVIGILQSWLTNRRRLQKTAAEMKQVCDAALQSGATRRAAAAILFRLNAARAKEAA
jgi:lipid-A-disaccharide synthase